MADNRYNAQARHYNDPNETTREITFKEFKGTTQPAKFRPHQTNPGYTDDGPQAMHCTSATSDVTQAGGFCLPLMRNVSRLGGIARLSFSFDLTRSSLACIFTAAVEPLVYVDDDGVG